MSELLTGGGLDSRHRSGPKTSRPESRAPSTSSRTYSALPWLLSRIHRSAACSTGPPSAVSTSWSTAASPSGSSCMRSAPASFQSDTIASGHGSPVRTVAMTKALPVTVRWSTSAADTGSSSCASSTPMTTLRPSGPLGQRLDAAAHEGEGVARPDAVGDDPGERSERHRRGALRRLHPVDERAALGGDARGLTREARLPDPGTRAQHEPAAAAVGASAHDPLQLLDAADERPRRARREHPGWWRGLQHAASRRVYGPRSCQRATLTGKVATQIAAPRNTTQASATSAACARA